MKAYLILGLLILTSLISGCSSEEVLLIRTNLNTSWLNDTYARLNSPNLFTQTNTFIGDVVITNLNITNVGQINSFNRTIFLKNASNHTNIYLDADASSYINGRLGINTANPSTTLDVNGTTNLTGFSWFNGFNDGLGGISTSVNQLNTRAIRPNSATTYDIGQATNTYRTFYINNTFIYGGLGIGIVNSTPRARLDVNDSLPNSNLPTFMVTTSQTNTSIPAMLIRSSTFGTSGITISRAGSLIDSANLNFKVCGGTPSLCIITTGNVASGTSSLGVYAGANTSVGLNTGDVEFKQGVRINNNLGVNVSATENMTGHLFKIGTNGQYVDVLSNGNVGVGIPSPRGRLHINSTGTTNPLNYDLVISGTLSAIGAGRNLVFTNANTENVMAYVGMTTDPVGNQGELAFGTATSTSFNATERVRIDNSGNVGIGTTTPSYKLDVRGGDINLASSQYLRGQGFAIATYSNVSNRVTLGNSNSNTNLLLYAGDTSRNIFMNGTTGNVGIGMITPQQKLDVQGNIRINSTNVIDLVGGTAGTFDRLDFKAVRTDLGVSFQLMPNGVNTKSKIALTNRNDSSNFGSAYIGVDNTTMVIAPQGIGANTNNVTNLVIGGVGQSLGGVNFNNVTIQNLAGTGNDYLCVDANGVLYRSDLGCT